jgi:hypothetical protein
VICHIITKNLLGDSMNHKGLVLLNTIASLDKKAKLPHKVAWQIIDRYGENLCH